MKTLKRMFSVLVMVVLSLTLISSVVAEDRMDPAGSKRARMEAMVDQYIQSREAKKQMMESKSEAVRESAKLSCEKADFCRKNRDRLVNELLAGGYEPVPEEVYPYLQMEFFEGDGVTTYVFK